MGTQSTHAGRTVSRSAAVAAAVSLDSAATFASDARVSTSAVNRQWLQQPDRRRPKRDWANGSSLSGRRLVGIEPKWDRA